MHLEVVLKLLVLIAVANGAPLLARSLLGDFLSRPLDGGMTLRDRRPLFGPAKTIRGIAAAVTAAALAAPLLALPWTTGLLAGSAAMAGDLLSSFLKRRLGWAPSGRATALDQIPESLIPALACMAVLNLTLADVILVTALFTALSVALIRLFDWVRLRDRPY